MREGVVVHPARVDAVKPVVVGPLARRVAAHGVCLMGRDDPAMLWSDLLSAGAGDWTAPRSRVYRARRRRRRILAGAANANIPSGPHKARLMKGSPVTRRLLLCLLPALLLPLRAQAHAILESSTPKLGGSIPAGPATMTLRYNSRIDRPRSRLTLTNPDKTRTVLQIQPDGPPD